MLTYNVPASRIESFSNGNLIVRSRQPAELERASVKVNKERLSAIQLMCPTSDVEPLLNVDTSVPLIIDFADDSEDLAVLYALSDLAREHPVSASVEVAPGFEKIVKVAVSLGFAVALEPHQPEGALVDEMESTLDYYLHNTTVDQPIEFFHSLLVAFYDKSLRSLWNIQYEDPSLDRYITDDGHEVISNRLSSIPVSGDAADFLDDLRLELLSEQGECSTCPFFVNCQGYFKFPDRSYSCSRIKGLLQTLKNAGHELRKEFARVQS
jgi:hypothetical protein